MKRRMRSLQDQLRQVGLWPPKKATDPATRARNRRRDRIEKAKDFELGWEPGNLWD